MRICPGRSAKLLSLSLLLAAPSLLAQSKDPADYPLRLHIFNRAETNFYHDRAIDEAKGDGRANLFANGEVRGVDFTFACSNKLKPTLGFETYPAKWKVQGKELMVLAPVFGKAGAAFLCDLHTEVKQVAYASHNGRISEESPAEFKSWMQKHEYDPEHGKNQPTHLDAKSPASPASTK